MPASLYLLDTNILLHLIRGKSTGAYIDSTYQLQKQTDTPLFCIVTHGEIWTLATENGWGPGKRIDLGREFGLLQDDRLEFLRVGADGDLDIRGFRLLVFGGDPLSLLQLRQYRLCSRRLDGFGR